ncbi:MAG: SDR family oxidoreductase [Desulfovibrio sp.]|nr:SDR family oxidoreductase [Desulfovibrio sp.]
MAYSVDLAGKTALITGGTRGIGAAMATLFAQAGANLIITGTSQQSLAPRLEALAQWGSGTMEGWVADFSDPASLDATCQRIRALPALHILVNNAGINHIVPIDEVAPQDLRRLLDLNLHAPVLLSGAAASVMKAQHWGRIVNVASIWSVVTKPGRAMYTSSKFGLVGLTKASAADLGGYNILVNALSPGFTRTDLTNATVPQEEQQRIAQLVPMRRFADPEEMAKVALFLCSDMNTYITGQNIVVDGGYVSV